MKRSGLLFFLILSVNIPVFAAPLAPAAELNRLSRVLRGFAPSRLEKISLQVAVLDGRVQDFLNQKTDEYLKSEEHALQMNFRLEELFWMKTNGAPLKDVNPFPNYTDWLGLPSFNNTKRYASNNAMSFLFSELARKNLSWDQLLVGKSYRLFDQSRDVETGQTDFGFLAALRPDLKSSVGGVFQKVPLPPKVGPIRFQDVEFAANDPRIAGALTTERFFTRFSNTALNKNRRRAATIFRVFLCDPMTAQIPAAGAGKEDPIFDLMFPQDQTMTEQEVRAVAVNPDQIHGQKADCFKCHYKLDPMGKTFLNSPLSLSPMPSKGRLRYQRSETERVDIPVSGLAELGEAIVRQPEYAACQVQHFWDWFIYPQTRIGLTPDKKRFLISEFDRVGRRTDDFIKILLKLPEFSTAVAPMTVPQARAVKVKAFLGKCQSCHNQVGYDSISDEPFANFTVWPIGGSAIEMRKWLGRIDRVLDLQNDGENPSMPPVDSNWRPDFSEIQLLKNWLQDGAPNENDERQVSP